MERISTNLESSLQMGFVKSDIDGSLQEIPVHNMHRGAVGTRPAGNSVQQKLMPNNEPQALGLMSSNHVPQQLSIPYSNVGPEEPRLYRLVKAEELGTFINNVESQQLPSSMKRKSSMDVASGTALLQEFAMPNKRLAHMEHRLWLQPTSTPSKLPVQVQTATKAPSAQRPQASSKKSAPSKVGTPKVTNQKNQTGPMQPSPKIRNESFDSVRSKLQESLAAALALVYEEQDKTFPAGKGSQKESAGAFSQTAEISDAGNLKTEEHTLPLPSKEDRSNQKPSDCPNTLQDTSSSGNSMNFILPDEDIPFGDSFFARDELLQGNGLSWILESEAQVAEKNNSVNSDEQLNQDDIGTSCATQAVQTPEELAFKIESELFKSFGGVNKKYKEKGRSLLFNLKDRNNPDLRDRVMSGDILPERLCSMTAEELASKELSEWRMAKAEELAQMVVLLESDVDMRRLVKKTHKGEFQVEVDHQDTVSAEVAVGTSSLTQLRPTSKDHEASTSTTDGKKEKDDAEPEKRKSEGKDALYTLTIPSNEGTDLMQGLMVDDELKDTAFLPPIVSLDEFMESLNSEPPFENLPVDTGKSPAYSDKEDSQVLTQSKSSVATPEDDANTTIHPDSNRDSNMKTEDERKAANGNVKSGKVGPASEIKGERVWEGILKLNYSVLASVIGIFMSGEKTHTNDWPSMVDIKGRVRLDAFEKFLNGLPMSRSRTVMVVHFIWKEGAEGSEYERYSEVVDSYVSDERVGFAQPAPGVELYTCPPQSRAREFLKKVVPKNRYDALNSIDNGLIGLVVYKRAETTTPPNQIPNRKHELEEPSTSRRHREKETPRVNIHVASSKQPLSHVATAGQQKPPPDEEDDDVPPGFGPPASRDEDDLPEFNFSGGPAPHGPQLSSQRLLVNSHLPTPPRPVEKIRELIQRYGQPDADPYPVNSRDAARSWTDDDDDMPEWRPEETHYSHSQPVMQGIHQPVFQGRYMQPPPSLAPQINNGHGSRVPHLNAHAYNQADSRQFNGTPGARVPQQGVVWPRDAPRSRGF